MSIIIDRKIEINENNIISITPAPHKDMVARTPIFFEAVHEWNKKAELEIAEGAEVGVDPRTLTMDKTINWDKGPAKKSQQEARKRNASKSVRVVGKTPEDAVVIVSPRKIRDTKQA